MAEESIGEAVPSFLQVWKECHRGAWLQKLTCDSLFGVEPPQQSARMMQQASPSNPTFGGPRHFMTSAFQWQPTQLPAAATHGIEAERANSQEVEPFCSGNSGSCLHQRHSNSGPHTKADQQTPCKNMVKESSIWLCEQAACQQVQQTGNK